MMGITRHQDRIYGFRPCMSILISKSVQNADSAVLCFSPLTVGCVTTGSTICVFGALVRGATALECRNPGGGHAAASRPRVCVMNQSRENVMKSKRSRQVRPTITDKPLKPSEDVEAAEPGKSVDQLPPKRQLNEVRRARTFGEYLANREPTEADIVPDLDLDIEDLLNLKIANVASYCERLNPATLDRLVGSRKYFCDYLDIAESTLS